jgi:hypothetical protein
VPTPIDEKKLHPKDVITSLKTSGTLANNPFSEDQCICEDPLKDMENGRGFRVRVIPNTLCRQFLFHIDAEGEDLD